MISHAKSFSRTSCPTEWHEKFLPMLPKIKSLAAIAFRGESIDARDEMVQEVICNALVAFKRLYDKGKADIAYPTVLARYAIRQVRDGRKVGGTLNAKDVMSSYAQRRRGFKVKRLEHCRDQRDEGYAVGVVASAGLMS